MSTNESLHLEARLRGDLQQLDARFGDERFMAELYRALASRAWLPAGGGADHVTLSWKRAEGVVNELRELGGHTPLELVQTGGEGQLATTVAEELARLGWESRAVDTDSDDPGHSGEPDHAPQAG